MTVRRKPSTKRPAAEQPDRTPSEALAHEIVSQYGDLAPSVNRILNAQLSEADCLQALGLFRDALATPSAPMRDPAAAVAAVRGTGVTLP